MMKSKVYIALSGGVDSAVSAALLKQQGYAVCGVHMKLWDPPVPLGDCSWQQDLEAAKEVAAYLKIPFEVWDFTKQYEQAVVDYLFSEYKSGQTPNPDVMCNKQIKFGLFYDRAMHEGANYIATGHYARIRQTVIGNETRIVNRPTSDVTELRNGHRNRKMNYELLRGVDPNKDQSYFLWAIPKERLARIMFPVGGMHKLQVRALARKLGLPNADRKDSQGVCFIGKIDLSEFLKLRIPAKKGEVVTTTGQVVGQHSGSWYYTVGQRHGFASAVGEPQYVAQKDVEANRLVVAPCESHKLYSRKVVVSNINWLVDYKHKTYDLKLMAQIRYRQVPIPARIQRMAGGNKGKLRVRFNAPVWALAPGQSMVLYKGALVLGGGIIESAY